MDYLLDHTGDIRQAIRGDRDPRPDNPQSFYADREQTSAIYLKANFGFDAWSLPIDGTAGLRY
ncbi:hypothetical protein LTR94_038369, partial [Friedmanniomyces endolithicus]